MQTVQSKQVGIHFSGHGGPGVLEFEDEYGRGAKVPIVQLVEHLRDALPGGRLPPFFYLASSHGNPPASTVQRASAAERVTHVTPSHRLPLGVTISLARPTGAAVRPPRAPSARREWPWRWCHRCLTCGP